MCGGHLLIAEAVVALADLVVLVAVLPDLAHRPHFDHRPIAAVHTADGVDVGHLGRVVFVARAVTYKRVVAEGNRASEAQMDVEEMSDEQFANLSEAEKKKLRGD